MTVEVRLDASLDDLDEEKVRTAVEATLKAEGREGDISVALVDDATIHDLNREYLAHDYPTDVLSFDLSALPGELAGEVIVSVEYARREAAERDIDPVAETLFYYVHGTLHILGWDDESDDDRRRMLERQRDILADLGFETKP